MTTNLDLNLLHALDALLQEGSVTKAAQRARLTTPAMSRSLGRLRAALSDELLVRAGRGMVLTPLAISLRDRAHTTAADARALLGPSSARLDEIDRTLVVRCTDAVAGLLVSPLVQAARKEAPKLRLRFVQEGEEDAASLRDGRVDLDVGVIAFVEPELRTRLLVRDRFVGVARQGHRFLQGRRSAERFAAEHHVAVSRRGRLAGPIDKALAERGLARFVVATVPDFLAALHVVMRSDLVSAVPSFLVRHLASELPLVAFALPVTVPEIVVAMAWHPRLEADPAHQWLRRQVQAQVAAKMIRRS